MFTSLTALLIAVALLATIPLGLRAMGVREQGGASRRPSAPTVARCVAAASLLLPHGPFTGLLVVPWLVAAIALVWQHRRAPLTQLVTLAWLPAAALWLLADRLGVQPLGFPSHLVALTAAHFHHAGFGVSALLASVVARRSVAVHQVGMVSVAAGLTVSYATDLGLDAGTVPGAHWLEPLGAACIIGTLVVWGRLAWRRRSVTTGWCRAALTVAAVAWAYPMALALAWALAPLGPAALLEPFRRTLTAMVAQHGTVNALAVVLLGLAALAGPWTRTTPPISAPTSTDHFSPTEQGAH